MKEAVYWANFWRSDIMVNVNMFLERWHKEVKRTFQRQGVLVQINFTNLVFKVFNVENLKQFLYVDKIERLKIHQHV